MAPHLIRAQSAYKDRRIHSFYHTRTHTHMHTHTPHTHKHTHTMNTCITGDGLVKWHACTFSCNLPLALLAEWLHFWQNDWDLLHATAVTQGWNGYQNKSQHRKLTQEEKILPLLLQGLAPATFQSRVRHSNHWAIPTWDITQSKMAWRQMNDNECFSRPRRVRVQGPDVESKSVHMALAMITENGGSFIRVFCWTIPALRLLTPISLGLGDATCSE